MSEEKEWKPIELELLEGLNESRKRIIQDKQHIELLEANVRGEHKRVRKLETQLAELRAS